MTNLNISNKEENMKMGQHTSLTSFKCLDCKDRVNIDRKLFKTETGIKKHLQEKHKVFINFEDHYIYSEILF